VHIRTNAPHKFDTRRHAHVSLVVARMPQRRQLNTDQTPPLCSLISCTYYSLEANERIASSLVVFCGPILLAISLDGTACDGTSFDGTDTTVDECQSLWPSSSALALLSKTRLMKSWNCG